MSTNFEDSKWYSYTSSSQTMRAWARQIKTDEEIPEAFRDAFPPIKYDFPYAVYVPEDKASRFRQREAKIFVVFEKHFVLLEVVAGNVQSRTSKFTDVLSLEHGVILLNSWLKINTRSGIFEIQFNTTNDRLFIPIIHTIRQKMTQAPYQNNSLWTDSSSSDNLESMDKPDLSQFDFLRSVNFKFSNYGKRSIRHGDQVLAVTYQPEQVLQTIGFFNQTLYKRYKTDFLIILTREELIFIKEEKEIRTNYDPAHGGVYIYIPQHQIQNITFTPQAENDNTLFKVTLPNNIQYTNELSSDNAKLLQLQELIEA